MTADLGAIDMTETAWAEVKKRVGADPTRETGGILLGWRHPGGIHVEQALEVPDREAGHTWYRRRHAPAEAALAAALDQLPEESDIGYVGEWHSHPAPIGPSFSDRRELRRISSNTRHEVALIVAAHDPAAATWAPYGLIGRRRRVRQTGVHITTREQPGETSR